MTNRVLLVCEIERIARRLLKERNTMSMAPLLTMIFLSCKPDGQITAAELARDYSISIRSKGIQLLESIGVITVQHEEYAGKGAIFCRRLMLSDDLLLADVDSSEGRLSIWLRDKLHQLHLESSLLSPLIALYLIGVYARKITFSGELHEFVGCCPSILPQGYPRLINRLADAGLVYCLHSDSAKAGTIVMPIHNSSE